MGPRAACKGARGTPGPSWCPYDPSRSIGHRPPQWHICPGAKAYETSSKSRFFTWPRIGPREVRAGAWSTPDPSGCPYDHMWSVGHHRKRASSTLAPPPRVATTPRVAAAPRVATVPHVADAATSSPRPRHVSGPERSSRPRHSSPKSWNRRPGPTSRMRLNPLAPHSRAVWWRVLARRVRLKRFRRHYGIRVASPISRLWVTVVDSKV